MSSLGMQAAAVKLEANLGQHWPPSRITLFSDSQKYT